MAAKIYRPAKTAMQSGRAKAQDWLLEFERDAAATPDPLMGWVSGSDTAASQVRLSFETLESALAYAQRQGLQVSVIGADAEAPKARVGKSYSDNFAVNRKEPWTH